MSESQSVEKVADEEKAEVDERILDFVKDLHELARGHNVPILLAGFAIMLEGKRAVTGTLLLDDTSGAKPSQHHPTNGFLRATLVSHCVLSNMIPIGTKLDPVSVVWEEDDTPDEDAVDEDEFAELP